MPTAQLDSKNQSVDDLLGRLSLMSDEFYTDDESDNAAKRKLLDHPLKQALFVELCAIKRRTALSTRNHADAGEDEAEVMRLDKMLVAEEVVGPDGTTRAISENYMHDQPEYKQKLVEIRESYARSMAQYSTESAAFSHQIHVLLQQQQQARPITQQEVQRMLEIVQRKLARFQIQLKQMTCEHLVTLRHRFLDQRRKRRNHSKKATAVLNHYFQTHISNPYPSEEDKLELARQCNITVNQVSNWFGNRRIRYKKSLIKQQQDHHSYGPPPFDRDSPPPPSTLPNPYAAALLISSFGIPIRFMDKNFNWKLKNLKFRSECTHTLSACWTTKDGETRVGKSKA